MSLITFHAPFSAFDDDRATAPARWRRSAGWLAAVVIAAASMATYQRHSAAQEALELARLDSFRAVYAFNCDVPSFREPAAPSLRSRYLQSESLRAVVAAQMYQLSSGTACEEIAAALVAGDYPVR